MLPGFVCSGSNRLGVTAGAIGHWPKSADPMPAIPKSQSKEKNAYKPAFSLLLGSLAHDRRLRSDSYDSKARRTGVLRVRRSVYCTASFPVCSLRRIELPIIYPDLWLDFKVATHPERVSSGSRGSRAIRVATSPPPAQSISLKSVLSLTCST